MKEKKEKVEEKTAHKEKKKEIVEVRSFWGIYLNIGGGRGAVYKGWLAGLAAGNEYKKTMGD